MHRDLSQDTWPPKHLGATPARSQVGPSGSPYSWDIVGLAPEVLPEGEAGAAEGLLPTTHRITKARGSRGTSLLRKKRSPSKSFLCFSRASCSFFLASISSAVSCSEQSPQPPPLTQPCPSLLLAKRGLRSCPQTASLGTGQDPPRPGMSPPPRSYPLHWEFINLHLILMGWSHCPGQAGAQS